MMLGKTKATWGRPYVARDHADWATGKLKNLTFDVEEDSSNLVLQTQVNAAPGKQYDLCFEKLLVLASADQSDLIPGNQMDLACVKESNLSPGNR